VRAWERVGAFDAGAGRDGLAGALTSGQRWNLVRTWPEPSDDRGPAASAAAHRIKPLALEVLTALVADFRPADDFELDLAHRNPPWSSFHHQNGSSPSQPTRL